MRYLRIAIFLVCCCVFCLASNPAQSLKNAENITIDADEADATPETGFTNFQGNVHVIYGDFELFAKKASVNVQTGEFRAEGNVAITEKSTNGKWNAPYVQGNFQTRKLRFGPYRVTSDIWYGGGESGETGSQEDLFIYNGWISTCEYDPAHYSLTASRLRVTKDHAFQAKHVVLRLGGIPVFYFPYLAGNTDGSSTFLFKPGYSGRRGAYLRIGRQQAFAGKRGTAVVYTDLMTKRGIALGGEAEFQDGQREIDALAYGLRDWDAPETDHVNGHRYNRRFYIQKDRYRGKVYWRENLTPAITLRANVDLLSDADMLEDWFRREYRHERQTKSFLTLEWDGGWFDAGLEVRPRINAFHTVVEKLPEIHFDIPRISLGDFPLDYQGSTRAGYYSMKWRKFDWSRRDLLSPGLTDEQYADPGDYQSWRLHSQHFLYLPVDMGLFGVLTPRAGMAVTYYSRTSRRPISQEELSDLVNADNPNVLKCSDSAPHYDGKGGSRTRIAWEFGAEWHHSFYSDWMDSRHPWCGVDGLQHVVEPYVNYTYMHAPSVDRDHIYYFDDLDRLEKQHFFRIGLDQRWLTHREGKTHALLRWQSYFDYFVDSEAVHGRYPGQFGNRWDFSPRRDWGTFASFVYDFGEGAIHRGEIGIRYGETQKLNGNLSYVYRNDHMTRSAYSLGSSLADFTAENGYMKRRYEYADTLRMEVNFPLNPLTWFSFEAEYDFAKCHLAEHTYTLRRQLHCWTMAWSVGWDNSEFETGILFSLTAFPKVKLKLDI